MLICEFCGTELPDRAHFCSTCGKKPSAISDAPTSSAIQHPQWHDLADELTIIGQSDAASSSLQGETRPLGEQTEMVDPRDFPDYPEEDEAENQQSLLPPGRALPTNNAPLVSGTPSIGGAPRIPGTPQIAGAPTVIPAGSYHPPSYPGIALQTFPLVLPKPPDSMGIYPTMPGFGPNPSGAKQPPIQKPLAKPKPGCNILVALLLLPFLILSGLFGLALTIYAPDLAVTVNGSANTTVASGGQFSLHGNNFIPATNVTLTLDDAPLYVKNPAGSQIAQSKHTNQLPKMFAGQQMLSSQGNNTISAGNDGKFAVTIHVGSDWRLGLHTLQATENLSPRSAKVSITVVQPDAVATPPAAAIIPTITVTAKPSTTSTPGTSGLSTITPGTVQLGPLAQASSQTTSSQVALNTTGTNLLSWTATWDQKQNTWLQLSPVSGQIQAPSSQPLTISAQAGSLNPGTYTATVTFSSTINTQTVTLTVIFTIQSACIAANPGSLNFTASVGGNDPTPQTFALSNCGQQINDWSLAQANTIPGWLSVSPMNGTLNNGDTQNITVSVTNANGQLKTGSNNQTTLQFVSGSSQITVQVTFTIEPGPTLKVSNLTLGNCPFNQDAQIPASYTCNEFLTVNAPLQPVSINWAVTSSGIAGILFTDTNDQPLNSGLLVSGQTQYIRVHIPRTGCPNTATITFTGPTNSVPVTWSC